MTIEYTVLGLQRSGTEFIEELIRRNLPNSHIANTRPDRPSNKIWKHCYGIKRLPKHINFLYTHKHPYMWIESILNNHVDVLDSYSYPHVAKPGKFMLKGFNIEALATLYRDHTRFWLDLIPRAPIYYTSYEDLIDSEENTIYHVNQISKFFNQPLINDHVEIPGKVRQSNPFTEKDREKYRNTITTILEPQHIEVIDKILYNIMLQQGYKK